jgi:Uma2 family endonuclease
MTTKTLPDRPIIKAIPPLQSGDRLSVEEFRRRYEAMPGVKAELIKGVVYMPSPVATETHADPHADFVGWLVYYRAFTPGVRAGDNGTLREVDETSEPQPDSLLRILPECGGQTRMSADGYIEGPPELIGEVAASSAAYDLHDKLDVYREAGVKEYIVWRVWDSAIDWFVLRDGNYARLAPTAAGVYQSLVFPGLWLDAAAMIRGDMEQVLKVVQEGVASPEHADFVQKLQQAAKTRSQA